MGRDLLRSLLLSMLVASTAFGQSSAPIRMYQPEKPELVGYPNWVLTPDGKARLDEALDLRSREVERLRAENNSLRLDVTSMAAKPALTWQAVVLLVGAGLVLGVGGTLGAAALARR